MHSPSEESLVDEIRTTGMALGQVGALALGCVRYNTFWTRTSGPLYRGNLPSSHKETSHQIEKAYSGLV
jgi:hypothetical protein